MSELRQAFIKFFTSLRVTVVLLALSIVLVFVATLDQVNLGIWAVQEKYFRTFFVLWNIKGFPVPVFPGGYFIGGLLLINLVASHVYRFKFTWKKAGITLTHAGLILLLVGELFTGIWQEEYQLRLDEGQSRNYSESYLYNELAVIDATDPDWDQVVAIPEKRLQRERNPIQHERLPFRIATRAYYPNAAVQLREELGNPSAPPPATRDIGARLAIIPMAMTYKQNERNLPAAVIELIGPDNVSLGTWVVSTMLVQPQTFDYAGRTWRIAMRFERSYKPYSVTLLDFTHDRYLGTEIPKNFASKVRLLSADGTTDRETLIYMNNPLRYDGLTFYQAGFDNNDKTTILQVVRNPSWAIPYLSCLLLAVGLYWQFTWHLIHFSARRRAAGAPAALASDPMIALGIVITLRIFAGFAGLWVASTLDGPAAAVSLALCVADFLGCAVLLYGLVARRAWFGPFLTVFAWFTLALLTHSVIQELAGGDIYQTMMRWVGISLHLLTVIGLFALNRSIKLSRSSTSTRAA
jgi:hypothetical protein